MWRSSDAHWADGQRRWRSRESPVIQSFASWPGYPTSSLAVWVMRNSLVPQRRIRARYVTVTKRSGTAVPPKSQSCRPVRSWKISLTVPSAISRPRPPRNRARAPDSSQSRMTLADCHSRVFAEYHPDRTTLMFSRITLNFSRTEHCWQND
jgi:hypothetical protein